uniref:Exocyst complex component Sec8 n=4 Tax=Hirondellea gigas TaxID=1518452 RepID=A0A6A7G535_9CRUS
MASQTPPKRPSRAVKQMPRESSGLLMSVIRTLSASESNEQRDREKAQLQREFNKSSLELDKHIARQDDSIKTVLEIFSEVSSRLSESRQRMQAIRENLVACKRLLHCKRDELKERWLEGVEHKHVMALLQQIDEVRDVGDKIGQLMSNKQYLQASRLLSTSLSTLHTHLQGIEALKQVHQDLTHAKESLYSKLIETLHEQLYHPAAGREAQQLRRNGSAHASGAMARLGSDRGYRRVGGARRNLAAEMAAADKTPGQKSEADDSVSGSESDPQHQLATIVECLTLLGKLPHAVETIKERMQKEFTLIIRRVNNEVVRSNAAAQADDGPVTYTTKTNITGSINSGSSKAVPSMATARNGFIKIPSRDARLMQELMQCCCDELREVVSGHEAVLAGMRVSAEQHQITLQLYTMPDVWSKVQAGLQVLISQYVDLSQAGLAAQHGPGATNVNLAATSDSATPSDISSYFAKKSKPRVKKQSLFKLDASYHAITLNSYLMEQLGQQPSLDDPGDGGGGGKKSLERVMVCQSSPHNITVLYNPLMAFIHEIEEAMGYMPGEQCSLHVFVSELLRDVFLVRLHMDTARRQEQATKALDLWTTTGHPTYKVTSAAAGTSANKPDLPLLQSSVLVWECLEELSVLMSSIPSSAHHFVSMMCNCLLNYRETCQAAYRGITQPDSEDKRVISATWAKDEDISRFLRDLPNWRALATGSTRSRGSMDNDSPDEVGERNRKEAEILLGSLGEQIIPPHEILSDPSHLRTLALLHQTMEWFGSSIVKLSASLSAMYGGSAGGVSPAAAPGSESAGLTRPSLIPQTAIQTLSSLAQDFLELAHTCLLVLHLEVRVHCFYYLLSVSRGVGGASTNFAPTLDSQDPDPEVLALNKDLASIDDALSATLPARKCKYIFEGLGPLISNIVTSWPTHIRRLNENGIKKMCRNILSLQQQLTNITMTRELALDRARQYYEMFYMTPQEVLNQIVNRGPQFSELEYMNALQLLHRSNPGVSKQSLQQNLQRLSEILGDVGVTV